MHISCGPRDDSGKWCKQIYGAHHPNADLTPPRGIPKSLLQISASWRRVMISVEEVFFRCACARMTTSAYRTVACRFGVWFLPIPAIAE